MKPNTLKAVFIGLVAVGAIVLYLTGDKKKARG
jgi:hypothetical protein